MPSIAGLNLRQYRRHRIGDAARSAIGRSVDVCAQNMFRYDYRFDHRVGPVPAIETIQTADVRGGLSASQGSLP